MVASCHLNPFMLSRLMASSWSTLKAFEMSLSQVWHFWFCRTFLRVITRFDCRRLSFCLLSLDTRSSNDVSCIWEEIYVLLGISPKHCLEIGKEIQYNSLLAKYINISNGWRVTVTVFEQRETCLADGYGIPCSWIVGPVVGPIFWAEEQCNSKKCFHESCI